MFLILPFTAEDTGQDKDIAGRELMSAPQLHPHSEGYAEFGVAALPAGVYVAQVEIAGRLSGAAKVVKQ